MSVFQFFQKHIDAIQYSHDNVDSAKVYNFTESSTNDVLFTIASETCRLIA